jgi:uncharacterized protein
MRIELARLAETDGKFAHVYDPEDLALSDSRVRLAGPLTVQGRISRAQGHAVVTGRMTASAQVECDRCLKLIELPVDSQFRVEYVTTQEYAASTAAELGEQDLDVSVFDGEAIDIDELVQEQLLLTVPSRVICSESCKGFCPTCGVDRNVGECNCKADEIDPRWEALKNLVDGK